MKLITNCKALTPAGHYSHAVIHNGLVYLSGQFSVDPETGNKKFGSIEEETKQILNNIKLILESVGSDKNQIIRTSVYISDISLWGQVDQVYSSFFEQHRPARSVVPTKDLHYGFKVEIEAIAALKA